jgi:hypothetical protein
MMQQMLTFMSDHAISAASERECVTNLLQGQKPQATLSLHNEPLKLRIFLIYGNLPHVPLPGNEYTVRIHGNQTVANSCNNRRNAIRF